MEPMQSGKILYCILFMAVVITGFSVAQPEAVPTSPTATPASDQAPPPKPESTPTPQVEASSGISESMEAAFLSPQKVAVLSAEVSGIIERIECESGDFVRQSDVLIQLNPDLVNLRVQRLENQIKLDTSRDEARITSDYRTRNLEITQKLFDTKLGAVRVGSPKELEEARQLKELADLGRTKAELSVRLLELELKENQKIFERHSIRAPFDGVIVPFSSVVHLKNQDLKKCELGESVQPGQLVIALMKVDRLRVQWSLPISQLEQVQIGRKAHVVIQNSQSPPVEAQVIYKSPTVEITGQFNIEVEFDNPPINPQAQARGTYLYRYRPGMRARVTLE
jgi:membrane fusion protein, multidrug efflux system